MNFFTLIRFTVILTLAVSVHAAPTKKLPYPEAKPSAEGIANQVYFVNHFYSVQNISFERVGKREITVLALREKDKKTRINTFRRFLNNAYEGQPIKAKDLVLFHSGKLIGTGLLVSEYSDESKSQSYKIWLPSLRKIRNFSEPEHDSVWGGSDFTYGDVYLRKPEHELHELIGEENFSDCLGYMDLNPKQKKKRYLKTLPDSQCEHKGKPVYKLKSTSKFKDWWYDYRISYVDTKTFADYRTDYFKNKKMVKRIDRDWTAMSTLKNDTHDPRAVFWRYWYGISYMTGHESIISVPEGVVHWNRDMESDFWSEEMMTSLRK